MSLKYLLMEASVTALSLFVIGCAVSDQNVTKTAPIGFITTPASYYSSPKARYLGMKYKENLDRLAERIVRNPKTVGLQFANNIASVGGIGFFTHSAATTADERFLEVIVSVPETFESTGDLNSKLASVFAAYGPELLSILAADPDIYSEREVSGYGLNLTWRSVIPDAKGTRVVLERAVIYVAKEKVRAFLHQNVDQKTLLADATIFTAADSGPMRLVSYRPQDPRLDTRLPIHEESIDGRSAKTQVESSHPSGPRPGAVKKTSPSSLSADGMRREQVAVSNSAQRIKEGSGSGKQGGDRSGDGFPETKKRSDHEAMVKDTVVQDPPVASKAPGLSTALAVDTTKAPEGGSVTKGMAERSEFKKAEAQVNPSPVEKADHDSASRPGAEQTGRVATEEGSGIAHSQGSAGVDLAVGISTSTPKTAADSNALRPKSAKGAADFPMTEPQPKLEKKVAPIASGSVPVERQDSRSGGLEPQRVGDTVSPTQPNPVEITKAAPDPVLTRDAHGDPRPGMAANVAPVNDTGTSLAAQNRGVAPATKTEGKVLTVAPAPYMADKTTSERIALQRDKTTAIMPKTKSGVGPRSKALEGYIIQLAFKDKGDARRWAESMEQRGYAVSVTEASETEAVRVRVGNFLFREEADRQLMALKHEGLAGIVINLPQAYRPDARTPRAQESATHPTQRPD